MGIHVEIYKSNGMDCTKGGESSYVKGFTITDIDGPFEPTREYPAAKIIGGRRIPKNTSALN